MKRMIFALLFVLMSAPLLAAQEDKVDICHFDSEGGYWKLISISGNADEAHFANHDDGLPGGETIETTTLLDDECEPALIGQCPCWDGENLSAFTLDNLYPGSTPQEVICEDTDQRVYWVLGTGPSFLTDQFDMGGYYNQSYGTGCAHVHETSDDQASHTNDQNPISEAAAQICMAEARFVGSQLGLSCIGAD